MFCLPECLHSSNSIVLVSPAVLFRSQECCSCCTLNCTVQHTCLQLEQCCSPVDIKSCAAAKKDVPAPKDVEVPVKEYEVPDVKIVVKSPPPPPPKYYVKVDTPTPTPTPTPAPKVAVSGARYIPAPTPTPKACFFWLAFVLNC